MSSGIKFNEDYADFNSDINRFGRVISSGTSMRDFAKTLKNEKLGHLSSLCKHRYTNACHASCEVTGKSITEDLQKYGPKLVWNLMLFIW